MSESDRFDELEAALTAVLAGRDVPAKVGVEVRDLALLAAHLLGLPKEEFRARLKADLMGGSPGEKPASTAAPEGSQTVVPYLVVEHPADLMEFVRRAFDAEELHRTATPGGGFHAEVRIGDAHVMMGGFPGMPFPETPAALHLYVPDADSAFRRAVEAGARQIYAPMDQPYGDREGGVRDPFGNTWYIATHRAGASHVPPGLRSVTPFLQVRGADGLLDFARDAFGARIVGRHSDPEGVVRHAEFKVAGSMIEIGEAHGEVPAIPAMLYVYVDDVDAWYARAVAAGGRPKQPPTDQPYGHRTGAVVDAFGNQWYMATPISKSGR
jgi:PhnB protein